MASNNGDINIKTKIDNGDIEKGLNDLKNKLSKVSGTNVVKGVVGLGSAFAGVSMAVKGANKAIKETTQLYRTQAAAEKQLEAAAKNNPYLNKSNVEQLKDFAAQLQSISTVGDETLIPLMAQLASAGRTQSEIQKIMSAALDVSASGMMNLETAVQSLNSTFTGNVGTLGRQIGELKNLTKEELESGAAVDIVAKQFNGMAKEVADATGSSEQLKNAWGDLKEEIGAGFEKNLSPMRKFFTQLVSGWANALNAKRKYNEAEADIEKGNASSSQYSTVRKQKEILLAEEEDTYLKLTRLVELEGKARKDRTKQEKDELIGLRVELQTYLDVYDSYAAAAADKKKSYEEQKKALDDLIKKENEQIQKEKEEAQAKANKDAADANAQKRGELRDAYDATLAQAKAEIEQRKKLGEEITAQQEAQELLNVATKAYVAMMTDPAFAGNSGNYKHEKDARTEIENWAKLANLNGLEESAETLKEIKSFLSEDSEDSLSNSITATIEALRLEQEALGENSEAWQDYTDRITELEQLKTKVVEKEEKLQLQKTKENVAELMGSINSYMQEFGSIVNNITSMMSESTKRENEAAISQISEQYTSGIISYEEYCEKKKQISKKQAQDEYKLNLWNWTSQLLAATANVALGVSKAIALGGVEGIISGSLVGAAGATQIAAIVANKPQMPAFATGGFITGNSYSGDKIPFRANAGESVLNPAEMRNFMAYANGTASPAAINMPVKIINNAANDVRASAQLNANGIVIAVDRIVKAGFDSDKYTQNMENASARITGVKYL